MARRSNSSRSTENAPSRPMSRVAKRVRNSSRFAMKVMGRGLATAAAGTSSIDSRFAAYPSKAPFDAAISADKAYASPVITAVSAPANQPAFVHCASANRASALWLIKRVQVDGWEFDRAAAEAADLGLTSPALKTFARDYIASHPR